MLDAEALVVGRRAHVAVVTGGERSVDTVDMAQTAVRHLKLPAQPAPRFVAANTIEHHRQTERGPAGAHRRGAVTGDAIRFLPLTRAEMDQVRKLDIRPNIGGGLRGQDPG